MNFTFKQIDKLLFLFLKEMSFTIIQLNFYKLKYKDNYCNMYALFEKNKNEQ